MRKIVFLGGFDKTDLILYLGIVLTNCGKKVLLLDNTVSQKSRYLIPTLEQGKEKYIATNQGVAVAVGYTGYDDIKEIIDGQDRPYDYLLIDTDNYESFKTIELAETDMVFLTTSYDLYSIRKAEEVFMQLQRPLKMNKIIFAKAMTADILGYLLYVFKDYKIKWGDISIFFPYDNGDQTIIYENQREHRMSLSKLSKGYVSSLYDLSVMVLPEEKKEIKKFIKALTKTKN